MNIRRITTTLCLFAFTLMMMAQKVNIVTEKKASNRELYAAEYLQKKLTALGYDVAMTANGKKVKSDTHILLKTIGTGAAEGYTISSDKKGVVVEGNDATGTIYGCVELAERIKLTGKLNVEKISQSPSMVMRGT